MTHRHFPRYNDDADFTTNAPSYYEDLARKEKLIRLLAERIWGYEKILDETLEEIQERFRAWDKNLEDFPDDVKILLQQWLADGTLDHIINDTIFNWKLDTAIFEQFRDSITAQLQQTEQELNAQLAETTQYLSNFKTEDNTWSQALQACIDYCATNYCKKIKLPPHADLIIDTPITNGGTLGAFDLIIEGDGKGVDGRGSCLTYTGSGYMFSNDLSIPEVGGWRGITFKDMTIRTSNNTLNGIKLVFTQQALFENVEFVGWNNAIALTGSSHYPYFKNCRFSTCEKGIHSLEPGDPDFIAGGANHGKIDNCFFTYCGNPIDILTEASGWSVDNVDFEGYNSAIILGNENILSNVRIERNNHLEPWLKIGNYNVIDISVGVTGGTLPQPLIEAGDKNEIKVGGSTMYLIDPSTFGNSNTLHLDRFGIFNPQNTFPFVYRLDKSNKILFIGADDNTNLLDPNLTNWFKGGGATITASTFSDSTTAYQIVNSGDGMSDVSVAIPGVFEAGDTLYLSLDREVVAGGGPNYTLQLENLNSYSIYDVFSAPSDNKKSVVAFQLNVRTTNPTLHIYISGDETSVKIGNIVANRTLNDALFA